MLQAFLHAGFQDFRGTAVSKLRDDGKENGSYCSGFRGLGFNGRTATVAGGIFAPHNLIPTVL